MQNKRLIPDNTFFSFFLHNTDEADALREIAHNFYIEIPPKINHEIKSCQYSNKLKEFEDKLHIFKNNLDLDLSAFLNPLFSKGQKEKGEHDVLAVGYFCYNMQLEFIMIIDDIGSRKFIKRNFSALEPYLEWTANFIKNCYKTYKIFNRDKTLDLLSKMGKSTFRIDKNILSKLIEEIKNG